MGSAALASDAPVDVLADVLGCPLAGVVVWAGKPAKTDRRTFVHVSTPDGRLWFAKFSDDRDVALRAEHEALRYVQALLARSPYLDACRQRVEYRDGLLIQEWRDGVSLREMLISSHGRFWHRDRITHRCAAITSWLAGFHDVGCSTERSARTVHTRGATHGDFKPANILIGPGDSLAIVDWELFEREGTQIHDLFHFVLYLGMTLTAPDRIEGLRRTLFERSWISDIARASFRRYLHDVPTTSESLLAAFETYIETMLERRAALGLSNQGYFLTEVQRLTSGLRHAPYAFESIEDKTIT